VFLLDRILIAVAYILRVSICVQPNKRLTKKLPKQSEVANILVGQVPFHIHTLFSFHYSRPSTVITSDDEFRYMYCFKTFAGVCLLTSKIDFNEFC